MCPTLIVPPAAELQKIVSDYMHQPVGSSSRLEKLLAREMTPLRLYIC